MALGLASKPCPLKDSPVVWGLALGSRIWSLDEFGIPAV